MSKAPSPSFLEQGLLSLSVNSLEKAPDLNHPLGLRRVSDTLANELFPGLSVYTRRAKYFSLISYWGSCGWLKKSSNYNKLDALLVWVTEFDSESNNISLVGKDTMKRIIGTDVLNPNKLPRISIPSYHQYRNPFKQCNFDMEAVEAIAENSDALSLKRCSKISDSAKTIVDRYIHSDQAIHRSDIKRGAFKNWQLGQLTSQEKTIIKNLLGIDRYNLGSMAATNRSLALSVVHSFFKERKHRPTMKDLVAFSNKAYKESSFKSKYLGSDNPFREIEIYDLFLTCLDVAFNAVIGLCILQRDVHIEWFRSVKTIRTEYKRFSDIKNHYFKSLEKETSGNKRALKRAYKLSCSTLDRLKTIYPEKWRNTQILLKKNITLVRDDSGASWIDWLIQQHQIYSGARGVEAWIAISDGLLSLHPGAFNYDYWAGVKKIEFMEGFTNGYRLRSINRLVEDLL